MAKHVYSDSSEIPHIWAHRRVEHARCSRGTMFFQGAALYSYGSHYLLGYLVGDSAFLNSDKYSVTTSKHQGMAASATRHMTQYFLPELTSIYDVLLLASRELSAAAIRKRAKGFEKARAQGDLGNYGYEGSRESTTRDKLASWLAENHKAMPNDGALWLAKRIGLTDSEVRAAIRKGAAADTERAADYAKREKAKLDRDGKQFAAMTPEEFKALWPSDGTAVSDSLHRGYSPSKPYDLRQGEEFAKRLSAAHKRAKAAGYDKRAAILWGMVKEYRAHLKGRDSRIIARHRSDKAATLWAWRRGEGKRPESYSFDSERFPAIVRRLERAQREERAAANRAAFEAWQAGDGKRPPYSQFEEDSEERAAILASVAAERASNESAYLEWKRDPSQPRPPASAFTGREYAPYEFKAANGMAYSRFGTMPENIAAEYAAAYPFADAASELSAAESAEKAEREAREKAEREAKRIETFRTTGSAGGYGAQLKDESGGAMLTVIGDELVTSWGARVPLADAIKVFKFAKLCRESGKAWHANGRRIYCGHYQIDSVYPSGGFKAGCHLINWPEIERAAAMAGVLEAAADDSAVISKESESC